MELNQYISNTWNYLMHEAWIVQVLIILLVALWPQIGCRNG